MGPAIMGPALMGPFYKNNMRKIALTYSTVTYVGISRPGHKFGVECGMYLFLSEIEQGIQKKISLKSENHRKGLILALLFPERLKMAGILKMMLSAWLDLTLSIFER